MRVLSQARNHYISIRMNKNFANIVTTTDGFVVTHPHPHHHMNKMLTTVK